MFDGYDAGSYYDELLTPSGNARKPARRLVGFLKRGGMEVLQEKSNVAEAIVQRLGISFTVYTEAGNIDRNWPLDIIPRVISESQWKVTAAGLQQRLRALNRFIDDVYHDMQIVRDGVVPEALVRNNAGFREECVGVSPPHGVWANICGTDLVRNDDGEFYVLEDNLRVPSGVSYMLENRAVIKRAFPEVFEKEHILPVDDYPARLFDMLASLAPRRVRNPEIVVLTPGIFNSAYFEHAYLAQQMGAELVEGSDLIVGDDDCVYMRTVGGLERVDVIYRRVDDLFLDPEVFNEDSVLGAAGLMRAWRAGKVAIANSPGSGVADDKAVYAYVPKMIEYYLGEAPILNNVPTYLCEDPETRAWVLDHLEELVVKPVSESGGYGLMIGPHSTRKERQECAKSIKRRPRNYVAQPTLKLSTAPAITESGVGPRHLDLRPFILQGKSTYVTTGGLTRVAMREGSLVVNSSQGGGSKDTWIVGGS